MRGEPGDHLRHGPAVERGHEQAERRRREHDPGGEAEEAVEQALGRVADREEGEPAHPCREARGQDPGERLGVHERRSLRPRDIGTSPHSGSAPGPMTRTRPGAMLRWIRGKEV